MDGRKRNKVSAAMEMAVELVWGSVLTHRAFFRYAVIVNVSNKAGFVTYVVKKHTLYSSQ